MAAAVCLFEFEEPATAQRREPRLCSASLFSKKPFLTQNFKRQ
jgi:hypothetical protein